MAQLENLNKNLIDVTVDVPVNTKLSATEKALNSDKDPELQEAEDIIKNGKSFKFYKIKKLTPELAYELVHVTSVIGEKSGLYLDSLTTIDAETAKALSKYEGYQLCLGGLKEISVEVAKELAKFDGYKGYEGYTLYLGGLKEISVEVAKELAKFKGNQLWLDGLEQINPKVARELANFYGDKIFLGNIKYLDKETVNEFTKFKCNKIYLRNFVGNDEILKELVYIERLSGKNSFLVFRNEETVDKVNKIREQESKELSVRESIQKKCEYFGYPEKESPSHNDFTQYGFYNEDVNEHYGNDKLMHHDYDMKAVKRVWKWHDEILPEWEELRDKRKLSFDWQNNKIKSWGQETLLESINADKEQIKLDGLDLELSIDEGIWLANLKNFVKDKRGSRKVEYKRDLLNKNVSLDKTLCLGNTMLITRADLEKEVSVCTDEEIIKKIAEWMNK